MTDSTSELLALCKEMREWLQPETVREPDRTFFWKLVDAIAEAEAPPSGAVLETAGVDSSVGSIPSNKRIGELEAENEKEIGHLIDERDAAEEALGQAYYIVTGRSPEWSNLFGHTEALEEIGDACSLLRQTAKGSTT